MGGSRTQGACPRPDSLQFELSYKRLERGTFCFPAQVTSEATSVPIDAHELTMLLEGIELGEARTKARWEPPRHATPPTVKAAR
jgi:hypothetical protein